MSDQRSALTVRILTADHKALQRLIPWGLKNPLFALFAHDLVKRLQADRLGTLRTFVARAMVELPYLMEECDGIERFEEECHGDVNAGTSRSGDFHSDSQAKHKEGDGIDFVWPKHEEEC